jgi:hypothetical protein
MHAVRSPLAYPPPLHEQYSSPPPVHPAPHGVHPSPAQAFSQPHHESSTPWSAGRDDSHKMEEPREKEKKKFWGVAWGDKKDKHKDRDALAKPMAEEKRPSFEGWRDGESTGPGSTGHHSHHSQSLSNSVPGQGMQMSQSQTGHYDGYASSIDSAENVTQALGESTAIMRLLITDILVRDPDPPMSSIYAVCDRVNQSQTPDSICKEAAKALRRHFKHGTEGERRATAKIWLIMMRNIGNDAFRRKSAIVCGAISLICRLRWEQEIHVSARDHPARSYQQSSRISSYISTDDRDLGRLDVHVWRRKGMRGIDGFMEKGQAPTRAREGESLILPPDVIYAETVGPTPPSQTPPLCSRQPPSS